jgi:hypothetical protein
MNYGAEIAMAMLFLPFVYALLAWTRPAQPPGIEQLLMSLIRAILKSL